MRAAIHITSSKFIKTLLVFVVSFIFSSAALVSNSFALDLTQDVDLIQGNYFSKFVSFQDSTLNITLLTCYNSLPASYCVNSSADLPVDFGGFTFYIPNRTYNVGDYITFDFYIFNNTENNSLDAWVRNIRMQSSYWDLIDIKSDVISTSSSVLHLTFRCYAQETSNLLHIATDTSSTYAIKLYPGEGIATGLATVWRPKSGTNYTGDIQNVISAIQAQPNYSQNLNSINNNINSVNNNLNTVNNNLEDLQETQEQANDDANDRYQDEKDTISGNGDDAQDSADSLSINFGVPWILQAWFNLFVDDSCASIPTISSWIHSTETRVCTPWPSAVRATLTPIFAIMSGLLLFGFVIRWLRGGMFNNSIEVG